MESSSSPASAAPGLPVRNAARVAFFLSGFVTAAWAPLVPFAKARLQLDEATLGLLLLCLGAGSLASMSVAASLTARFGCKKIIIVSGTTACAALPLLALAPTFALLAGSLLLFGAAMGILDVAQNIHATQVQKLSGKAMMSGFHGMYSVGGFAGAGGASLMLLWGLTPVAAAAIVSCLALLLLACWGRHLIHESTTGREPAFAVPRGIVLVLGVLCFIMFLAEGAMLDWSAVFLSTRGVALSDAGIGYSLFAIAMTFGRFIGDRLVRGLGGPAVLRLGSVSAAAGFALAVAVPLPAAGFAGCVLIGLGASNIVPVLFTEAGNQSVMPMPLAIAAISLFGYSGVLAGPALIGFLAHATNLDTAFAVLGLLVLTPALAAGVIFSRRS